MDIQQNPITFKPFLLIRLLIRIDFLEIIINPWYDGYTEKGKDEIYAAKNE